MCCSSIFKELLALIHLQGKNEAQVDVNGDFTVHVFVFNY